MSLKMMALAGAACIALTSAAHATTWSASGDFSSSSNPNGAWSYLEGNVAYTATETLGGLTGWYDAAGSSAVPAVLGNTTGAATTFGTLTVQTNELLVHPWIDNSGNPVDSIVRWTAPAAGTYDITGFFQRIDNTVGAGDGVTFDLLAGGTSLTSGAIGSSNYNAQTFSYVETLAAGQSVDFAVGPGSNFFYDSTGLNATISTVPEPLTAGLLFTGLATMAMTRRRRAAKARG